MRTVQRRRPLAVGAALTFALALAGCSSSSSGGTATSNSPTSTPTGSSSTSETTGTSTSPTTNDKPVTLTMGLFGTIGDQQKDLYAEYMKLHPNVTIKTNVIEQGGDALKSYQTKWAANAPLDDIIAIEQGFVGILLKDDSGKFVDMNKIADAAAVHATFQDWKWKAATAADGTTIGLGLDAGPEAFCYRSDMLKAAGLPSEPAALAEKIKTWPDLIALGRQYMASPTKPANSAFIDGPSTVFSSEVYQHTVAYSDTSGKAVPETSDGVKAAWADAVAAAQAGITAKFQPFNGAWGDGFAKSTFAAISCPSWMLGYIQGQAGAAGKGKWNITTLPGGSTNWGGSWMGIPKDGKNVQAATDLLVWLTAPAQQVKMWVSSASFPSSLGALNDPAVKNAKSAYFQDAPIGEIYSKVAQEMKITAPGPYDSAMQTAFLAALNSIETQKVSAADAWKKALADIKDAVSG